LTARTISRTSFASPLARQTANPLLGSSFVRYNSSAPTPTPAPTEASTPFDPATSNLFADPATAEVATNVTKIVDETKSGFLSELGIDNGFGPTSLIESLMENIHVYTGLPWWGTIVATTVVIRTLQFPFYCKLSDTAARLRELTPFTAPIEKKMMEEQRRGNLAGMMTAKQEMAHIYKTAKVNRLWLAFPITQIPIFFGFYNGLRGMAEFPVPGMLTGGFGWIKDLTVMDPYFLMPALSSASLAAQFWVSGLQG
jgi:YidC/Oxa1 family membrane protein insertase